MRHLLMAVVVICVALIGQTVAHDSSAEIDELKAQIIALTTRLARLEAKVASLGKEDAKEESVDDSHVLVLDGSNFDAKIAENDLTLVEFYAPWCGHCKQLAPEYNKAAAELEGAGAGALAKVDCTADQNRPVCEKYGVNGYPTIKLFRKTGNPSDYSSERNAEAIVKFMKKQSQPAVSVLNTVDDIESFGDSDSIRVIAILTAEASDEQFKATAEALRSDVSFGVTRDAAAATKYGVTAPAIVLLRDFDEPAKFTGSLTSEKFTAELTQFVKAESFPILGLIGPENYMRYVERGLNFVWIFHDTESEEQDKMLTDAVTPVAVEFRGKLSFVKLDGKMWGEHAKTFGLSGNLPGVAIEDRDTHRNYIFDEKTTLTKDSFHQFIKGYLDGTLKPHLKSEEEPTDNSAPVKVIVGTTYDKIVLDDSKDVLVEFYAPWCGHCKQLAPKYDELGQLFANDNGIVIAKVDATANDTPEQIEGFPTIKFYPAGDKKNSVTYTGDRTTEAMAEFIRENRKTHSATKDDL